MIDIDELTVWDVYKMVLNAKPLSNKRYEQNAEFSHDFDDMYFNDAVELVGDTDYEIPFVYKHNIEISKCWFVGTGDWGEPMSLLGGADHYKSGKRVPGTIQYTVGVYGENPDENIMSYLTFDDALQSALYYLQGDRSWKDLVTETIYQNNYNPNKFLSVFTFNMDYGDEYYVMQYIETYNPALDKINRNNIGNRLGEDYHYEYSKSDLDALLQDYTEVV